MRYLFILFALLCVSCGTALPTVKPYKLDVQQGNVVTSKMLLQLRPGMTKSQVRFIMGTPLVQDSFHGNRWDYVYQMREGGKITEQRRVILDFENELLKKIRGDVIPAGSDQSKLDTKFDVKLDGSEAQSGTRVITPGKKTEDKSLISKLKFWEKDEAALAKAATEKEAALKAKAEAEESAKMTSVKEKVAPAVEESQSMLAVPLLEVPVTETLPVATTAAEVATPETAEIKSEQSQPMQAAEAPIETAAMLQPESLSTLAPLASPEIPAAPSPKTPSYESTSGMLFDSTLRSAPEEVEPVSEEVQTGSRAKNNVPPKPKELPTESNASFFDRMLESIGF